MLDELMFNTFLNKISAMYVIDENTHTVVRASELLIDELSFDPTGKKCYEALCGEPTVCGYCPALTLAEDKPYAWEYYDEVRQRNCQILNRLLLGPDGKTYRVGQIMDIQESMVLSKYALGYLSLLKDLTDMQSKMLGSKAGTFEVALPFVAKQFSALAVAMVLGDIVYTCSTDKEKAAAKIVPGIVERVDRFMRDESYRYLRSDGMTEEEAELFLSLVSEAGSYGVSIHSHCVADGKFTLAIFCAGKEPPMDDQLITVNVLHTHVENHILQEQILWDNSHDKMTALFNRSEYFKRVYSNYRNAQSIGIIYLDVDGLKAANDKYGHSEGDKLILKASHALLSLRQFGCDIFRMGGDEFVVACPEKSRKFVREMCDNLQDAIDAQNRQCPAPQLRMSMGTAWAEGSFDISNVYGQADTQMYASKRAAKEMDLIQRRD